MLDFYDVRSFPILTDRKRAMQVASFDRKEENGDWGNFLYKNEDGSAVLLEETGAGCLRSFWAAVTTDDAEMKFFFDGEDEPRYSCTVRGFFNGAVPELSGPGNTFLERGQWDQGDCFCGNFFRPIPYEKGLKIVVSGTNLDFYYHILYEKFGEDQAPELCEVGVNERFIKAFAGRYERPEPTYSYEEHLRLEHDYTDGYIRDEAGVVTEMAIEYDEELDLSSVYIDVSIDNDPISKIACPITYFFAEPCGFTGIDTIAACSEKKDGKIIMRSFLPIPYWKRFSMCLVNFDRDDIELTLKLRVEENKYDPDETGYLYVNYRHGDTELFEDWKIGEFPGRGHVVGIVQKCRGGQWCEGNEHFYIDGEISPSINGTGTEDLYLGCYWPNKKYDSPVAGCTNNVLSEGEALSKAVCGRDAGYYRFFHDMPIAFEDGIKLTIQHGAVGQTYSHYSSACFSYRQPYAKAAVTDFISVSSSSSREMHDYTVFERGSAVVIPNEVVRSALYPLEGKIEGDRNAPKLSKRGLLHDGKISFFAAVNPENRGVIVRVLTDLSKGPMRAKVSVEGQYVGLWTLPEFNDHAPFGDCDFEIPASFTVGKDRLKIELIPEGKFADFEYKIITRLK
ncbi:MAG: DUF2961 domain-containing protein [Clostridia bacterium]|nr:DUF2961 domain-containing protein [Clostridia bacterium]